MESYFFQENYITSEGAAFPNVLYYQQLHQLVSTAFKQDIYVINIMF